MSVDIRGVALDPARLPPDSAPASAGPGDAHVGDEVGEHDLLDARLAERWQHPLDVAQEHPVRPDDEHPLVLQREPVGVQQVGGAVQRNDRLAGPRAALDDEHAGLRRTDDLVLFGLDRGDDVAERSRAAAFEGGEQRRVAAQPGARRIDLGEALVVADAEMAVAEQLVLDAQDGAAFDGEVAAALQAHRLTAGCPVERLGHRRAPVDDDGLGVLVGDGQPADVEALRAALGLGGAEGRRLFGTAVDPPEHQCGIAEVELVEPLDKGFVEGVALETGLHRAAEVGLVEVSQAPRRRFRRLQAVVGEIDVRLLGVQFWVLLGQTFPSTSERVKLGSGHAIWQVSQTGRRGCATQSCR